MSRSFIQLWTRKEFEFHRENGEGNLLHAASNQFSKRGMCPGDKVFIASCFLGRLRLLGVIQIWKGPLSPGEAAELTGKPVKDLSWAADHILAHPQQAQGKRFDLQVPEQALEEFRFATGEAPKFMNNHGGPDPQTFRGVRELSEKTAQALERLLHNKMQVKEPEKRRALSIRQPYAERILLGEKKIEYRSWPTVIRERVYIYAAKTAGLLPGHPDDLDPLSLPRGVLVGSVEIVDCQKGKEWFEWQLAKPARLSPPLRFRAFPQAGFFYPFGRPGQD
ncbi:MAG: ASCH domain-containing protein [Gemmataceae bacterium]|nr:ASCH domain-containing protein [Gemmataceae bacterium]